ncbi:MAG: hypothetical protein ABIK28_08030 [Planctomycetota bacterium]
MKNQYPGMLFLVCCAFWAGAFLGCTSTSVLSHGENRLVRFQQYDKNTHDLTLELQLVEESHQEFKESYSEKRTDGNLKLIPEEMFCRLITTLDDLGFVEMAKPKQLGSDPRTPGTTKIIIVENDSGQWVCTNSKTDLTEQQRLDFALMERMILNCYDSVLSLQVITNEKGSQFFFDEQQQLNQRQKQGQKLLNQDASPKRKDP